jgi:YVTN family beta-propeller protein
VGGGGVIQGLAVSPDGKHVYGTVRAEATETFVVIDTTTNPPKVVQTIELRKDPEGIAVSPDGKHVYVARTLGNNVAVIDTPFSGPARVVAGVGVGADPKGVAVTPDGTQVYVTNAGSHNRSSSMRCNSLAVTAGSAVSDSRRSRLARPRPRM